MLDRRADQQLDAVAVRLAHCVGLLRRRAARTADVAQTEGLALLGDVAQDADPAQRGDDLVDACSEVLAAETAVITAGDLTLTAAQGIGSADDIDTDVTTVTATNSTSGDINIFEVNGAGQALSVLGATQATAGAINIQTADGDLTIDGAVSVVAGDTITLIAGDAAASNDDDLTLNSTVTSVNGQVTLTAATNDVVFAADGDVTTTSGLIQVNATNGGGLITMADGAVLNAGDDLIDLNADGNIALGSVVTTNATATAVDINTANGAVTDAGDTDVDIVADAGEVTITAETGVGNGAALETTIDDLSITNDTSGNVEIDETGALDILFITQTTAGAISVTAGGATNIIDDGNGGAGLTTANASDITVDVNGDATLTISQVITTQGGAVTITADDDVLLNDADADISSTNGAISITADSDSDNNGTGGALTMNASAVIDAGNSTITLDANEDITIGQLTTTGAVNVTLATDAGVVGENTVLDINAAAATLVIDSATGVGSGDDLDTTVAAIDIDNSTSGDVVIDETDALNINRIVQVSPVDADNNGNIAVTADGNITVVANGNLEDAVIAVDGGVIGIEVDGAASLTVNDGVSSVDGGITLVADDDVIFAAGGDLTASGAGNVTVTADTDGDANGAGGLVTMADGTLIDGGSGTIALTADETITVGGLLTTNTGATAVTLTTSAAVADAGGTFVDVVAADGRLVVDADEGISLDTTVDSIDLDNNVTGAIDIDETDNLTVIQAVQDEDDSITILAGGSMTLDAAGAGAVIDDNGAGGGDADILLRAEAGSLTIDAIVRNDSLNADADITLDADGTASSTAVTAAVSTAAGDITITADDDVTFGAAGDVTATGAGNIVITADNDGVADGDDGTITMNDGTLVNAGGGTLTLSADEDITLGGLLTTNATAAAVAIKSAEARPR